MKKVIYFVMIFCVTILFADNVKVESPFGSFSLSVDTGSSQISTGNVNIADEIAKRVEKLENKYLIKLNKLDQKRANKITDEIYQYLALLPDNLTAEISSSQTVDTQPDVSAESNSNINININMKNENETVTTETNVQEDISSKAMDNSEFNNLLKNVHQESFDDDKLSVIRIAAKRKYFTINQLVSLINEFSFSDDKINCVRIVFPKVIDKDNAHNLLSAFTYSSDKEEVEAIINQ